MKRQLRTVYVFLVLAPALAALLAQHVQSAAEEDNGEGVHLFQQAMWLRGNMTDSMTPAQRQQQQQRTMELLKEAGCVSMQPDPTAMQPSNSNNTAEPQLTLCATPHAPALKELAYIYLKGDGVPIDFAMAFELFQQCSAMGESRCQGEVALYNAWGIQPRAPENPKMAANTNMPFRFSDPDTAASVLHYYFASSGGDHLAQMTLGYRHKQGLGVPKSCSASVLYYQPVAEYVTAQAQKPWGLPMLQTARLSSRMSSPGSAPGLTRDHEVLNLQWWASMGNVLAQLRTAQLLAQTPHGDLQAAVLYYRRAAEAGSVDAVAALGHAYANGLGVPQNNKTAYKMFKKAADAGHPSAMYGLGYMLLTGHGIDVDYTAAFKYLKGAGDNAQWTGAPDAWFLVGMMYYKGMGVSRSTNQAFQYFSQGAKMKHLQCMYNLAMMHLAAQNEKQGCSQAVALFKQIAERGPWGDLLQEALDSYAAGDYATALWCYLRAAELGYEVAQANAAWLLRHVYGSAEGGAVAVALHRQAADQGNVDSLLALGDSYYYGWGMPRDLPRAAEVYQRAASKRNAQALYNLGFMYEYGAGLAQDFHLAKRYYDKALETEPKAVVPITLALMAMALHMRWYKLLPLLPLQLTALLRHMMSLPPHEGEEQGVLLTEQLSPSLSPAVSAALAVLYRPVKLLGTVVDNAFSVLDADWLGPLLGGFSEKADTVLLFALLAALGFVLRRRQALRRQQQAARQATGTPGATRRVPAVPTALAGA